MVVTRPGLGDLAVNHAPGGARIGHGTEIHVHDQQQPAAQCADVVQESSGVEPPCAEILGEPEQRARDALIEAKARQDEAARIITQIEATTTLQGIMDESEYTFMAPPEYANGRSK